MTYISIHLTSSTMRLIHLMSFLDWIWVSHRGEDKLQRRHPVPQGLLLQPEKLSIQFSTRDCFNFWKQNKKFRNLSIQFSNRKIFTFANKTRTVRLYRPPPSSPDQTVLCRGSQIQYDSSVHKIFITNTFLCQGRREFLGPRGPLVLPLVDPPSRKKNPDHFYTGWYALRIIKRLIKPTRWPHGIPKTSPWPPGTPWPPSTPSDP